MAGQLSKFEPVAGAPGLFTATKNNLRCTAIQLRSGGLCLFSPVSGLSELALSSLVDLGQVGFLLAPNHFHNGGLVEYAKAYPSAALVASPGAQPRLQVQTGLSFAGLETLQAALPSGMRLACPEGLKNGEVWLIAATNTGHAWHVVDAFASAKNSETKITDVVRANKVFPSFAVKDRNVYMQSALALLDSSPPKLLLPGHGAIVLASDLPEQIRSLLTDC